MTKMKLTAIAATTWVGGLVALGALAYTLNRPFVAAPTPTLDPPSVTLTPLAPVDVPAPEPERVIVLPTVNIIGNAPAVAHVAPPPRALHCSDWRPLEQGGNSVQICE